jgi:hypothetical protein
LPAVRAAEGHPSDEHMPRLIAIALDPNKIGPNRPWWMPNSVITAEAARAVAINRTDEGVAALKRLLDSPDVEIRRDVSTAIRGA